MRFPALQSTQVGAFFAPGGSIYGVADRIGVSEERTGLSGAISILGYFLRMFGVPVIAVAFEIYAFVRLFMSADRNLTLVVSSLAVCALDLIVLAAHSVMTAIKLVRT